MIEKIKLLLVDDHPLFRSTVAQLLNNQEQFEVVGQAANGEEAVGKALELKPDVILMDIQMPGCSGIGATRILHEGGFPGSILMLTVSEVDEDLFSALERGAIGYILKGAEIEEVFSAIIHAAYGGTVIRPVMATKLLANFKSLGGKRALSDYPTKALSEREEDILNLVASGATNKDIATALFITENTVKCHMRNIMSKLHMKSRYHVVA